MKNHKSFFLLSPDITYLNHGSFGACPKTVFNEYQRWQNELEKGPVEFLIEKGFDAKLGARPLARIIDNEIKKPLSRMILFGELQDGGRVEVTVKDKKLAIDYKKPVVIQKQKIKKVNEKTS